MTLIDWIVCAILFVSVLSGLKRGLIRTAFSLFGLLVGLAVAGWNYHHVAGMMTTVLHERAIAEAIAFLLIAIAVMIVSGILGGIVAGAADAIGLGWLDAILGGGFGLVRGALLVTLGIAATVAFFPQAHWLENSMLVHRFFGLTHLSSHVTPSGLESRIEQGIAQLRQRLPHTR